MHIPPPLIALAGIFIIYGTHRLVPALSLNAPGQVVFGIVLAVAGIAIAAIAAGGFYKASTTIRPDKADQTSALVTEGPYQFTRNPMYLGMAMVLAGCGIGFGTLATPIVLIGFVWIITNHQILPEENALTKLFGQQYLEYQSKVRRWI